MQIASNFIKAIKKTFVYKGVATRSEYWSYFPLAFLLNVIFSLLNDAPNAETPGTTDYYWSVLAAFLAMLANISLISLTVRRLHDLGKSGWWTILVYLVPCGFLYLLHESKSAYETNGNNGSDEPI